MPEKQFPVTTLFVEELSQSFETTPDGDNPNIRKGTVTLPQNESADPKVYTIKVYTNGSPTDVTTTVTVQGNPTAPSYHEPTSVTAEPNTLDSAGGNVTVTVNFNVGG